MNEIIEIMENEKTNLRSLKKQQLFKINKFFGHIFKKKTKRKKMIDNLIPINRKMVIYKKIIDGNEDCPICFNNLTIINHLITTCGHAFCIKCIFKYVTSEKEICPICREPYTYEDLTLPFTPKDINNFINTQVEINQETIQEPPRISNIYRMKNIIFNLICITIKLFLYFKSMFFLYLLIVTPLTPINIEILYEINYTEND